MNISQTTVKFVNMNHNVWISSHEFQHFFVQIRHITNQKRWTVKQSRAWGFCPRVLQRVTLKLKWSAPRDPSCICTLMNTYKAELCEPGHLNAGRSPKCCKNVYSLTSCCYLRMLWVECKWGQGRKLLSQPFFSSERSQEGGMVIDVPCPRMAGNTFQQSMMPSYLWLRCSTVWSPWVREPFPRWQTRQRRLLHSDCTPGRFPFQWQGQGGGYRRTLRHSHLQRHRQWMSHWCRPSDHPFWSTWRERGSSRALKEETYNMDSMIYSPISTTSYCSTQLLSTQLYLMFFFYCRNKIKCS